VLLGAAVRYGREQGREQLSRFGLLGSRQRLEPRQVEPELIVIDWSTQRHKLAAAVRRVRIGHSAVEPAEGFQKGSSLSTLTVG
jgi:hypothetical protein